VLKVQVAFAIPPISIPTHLAGPAAAKRVARRGPTADPRDLNQALKGRCIAPHRPLAS
jgi:hypothetical protein